MPRSDGLAAGARTQFSSAYQPANRGRKPSKLKKWIKEYSVSVEDFTAVFRNIIAVHTLGELEELVNAENKKKLPVIVALCVSAFLRDMKTGTLTSANTVLDRVMGKPAQSVKMSGTGNMVITVMTPDERKKRIKELLAKGEPKPEKPERKRTGRASKPS